MAAGLRVQATGAASGVADVTATLTGVQAGDFLVGFVYERDGATVTAFGDSVNGAWTLVISRAAVAARIAMYFFPNSGAGNPLVTVTLGGTTPRDINVSAWTGMPAAAAVDVSGQAGNTGVTSHPHAAGNITPSAASLILTCMGLSNDHGGMTPHTGFTALNTDAGVAAANRRYWTYKVGHTGAINPTHTSVNSQSSDCITAAFVETAAASAAGPLVGGKLAGRGIALGRLIN